MEIFLTILAWLYEGVGQWILGVVLGSGITLRLKKTEVSNSGQAVCNQTAGRDIHNIYVQPSYEKILASSDIKCFNESLAKISTEESNE